MCSSRAYFLEQDMSAAAPSAVLPTYDGIVLAKVLSLDSDAACLRRKSMLRRKQHVHSTDDASFLAPAPIQANKKGEVVASQPKPVQQQQQRQQQESPSPSPKVSPPPPAKEYNFFSNSSDDQDEQQHPQQSSPATNSGSTTNHSSPPPSSTPAPVLNRAALAEKRQHDIDDKVAAALAEKKDV